MNNQKTVTITKIGRNADGDATFGFGMTDSGHGVYIVANLIKALGWDESSEWTRHNLNLSPNSKDRSGTTPYMATSVAIDPETAPIPAQTEIRNPDRLEELEEEVRFHKLRGLMPWGQGTSEAARRAISPYGDQGEYCTMQEVMAEMTAMGFAEASAAPTVSMLRKVGYVTKDGETVRVTAEGSDAISAAVAAYDAT